MKQFKEGGKSPHLKKLKTIIHPGEVRLRLAFKSFLLRGVSMSFYHLYLCSVAHLCCLAVMQVYYIDAHEKCY